MREDMIALLISYYRMSEDTARDLVAELDTRSLERLAARAPACPRSRKKF
jgi:hypothetical protein